MLRNVERTKFIRSQNSLKEAEVPLKNNHNYDYIGEFSVGNPPQKMRGCFDTGSANSWILSSKCGTDRCRPGSGNLYFTPELSSTFFDNNYYCSIQFGSGALAGYFGNDDFRVGAGENQIHIKHQTLGIIHEEHVLDREFDAIIGLAYP